MVIRDDAKVRIRCTITQVRLFKVLVMHTVDQVQIADYIEEALIEMLSMLLIVEIRLFRIWKVSDS